jgi:hypothetical protein
MNRHDTAAPPAGIVCILGLGLFLVIPCVVEGVEEGPSVAFRAKASVLPGEASAAQGKGPDEIVEIVLPGRVYEPPIKVIPVKTKGDANRKTPEQASASDFSAFREADPGWLRENFVDEDYPQIKRMVEDPNMRKLNQRTYMNYGEKTIVSRCAYKDFALVFIRYDGVATNGVIEVYQKAKGSWKRTNALTKDDTLAVLLTMFRQGTLEQISR